MYKGRKKVADAGDPVLGIILKNSVFGESSGRGKRRKEE